ncbi:hypothetical protein GH714_033697 [Hevea brasiliensis]|uniref:RNase H type-1 domain-containing protein n=1 Tax=Hevea brasiliensis TaxID=3981 RepID=A0A6A6LUB6_HEVBR|nr:hypothetical protein GH714_033697 [Hevea brasiliensis]
MVQCKVLLAELWALYEGLKMVKRMGVAKLWIECDNLLDVHMATDVCASPANAVSLVNSIKGLLRSNWSYRKNHIWREANFSADFLAGFAAEFSVGVHELQLPSHGLLHWLCHDVSGTAYSRFCSVKFFLNFWFC